MACVLGDGVGGALERLNQRVGTVGAAVALLERLQHRRVQRIELERLGVELAGAGRILEPILDEPALLVEQHRLAPRRRRELVLGVEQRERCLEVAAHDLGAARATDRGHVLRRTVERLPVVLRGLLRPARRDLVRASDLVVEARRAQRIGRGLELRLARRDHRARFGRQRRLFGDRVLRDRLGRLGELVV